MKILILFLFPLLLSSQAPAPSVSSAPPAPKATVFSRDWFGLHDDAAHVYGSWIMNMTATEIAYYYTDKPGKSIAIGASTSLAIGVLGKEFIHDLWTGRGVFSLMDIFYDFWGNVLGTIVEVCWIDWRKSKQTERRQKNDYRKHIMD